MARAVGITTSSFAQDSREPLEILKRAGLDVRLNPHGRKLTREETVAFLREADGVIAGTEALDRAVLERLPRLQVISRVGTGTENVDLAFAAERAIRVYSTPGGPTQAVAELALGGLLAVLRRIAASDAALRRGEWHKPMGHLLCGVTVGVIGLGRVGKSFARLLVPFGVKLLAVDPVRDEAFASELGVEYCPLETLLSQADVVALHLSGLPRTPLLGPQELGRMKAGAIVLNLARGGWVDEVALAESLRSGHLGGAYLDVFAEEPYQGPLRDLSSVVLTPHIGSYAVECRIQMEVEAAEHLVEFFGGLPPDYPREREE